MRSVSEECEYGTGKKEIVGEFENTVSIVNIGDANEGSVQCEDGGTGRKTGLGTVCRARTLSTKVILPYEEVFDSML